MSLAYRIDPERRLVIARFSGILKDPEVFEYQESVWSRPEIAGYNELVDMRDVRQILLPSVERLRDLAELAADMSRGAPASKLAIAAPGDLEFGLSRMFEHFRENSVRNPKSVGVFRTMEEALEWLGIEGPLEEVARPA